MTSDEYAISCSACASYRFGLLIGLSFGIMLGVRLVVKVVCHSQRGRTSLWASKNLLWVGADRDAQGATWSLGGAIGTHYGPGDSQWLQMLMYWTLWRSCLFSCLTYGLQCFGLPAKAGLNVTVKFHININHSRWWWYAYFRIWIYYNIRILATHCALESCAYLLLLLLNCHNRICSLKRTQKQTNPQIQTDIHSPEYPT